MLLGTGGFHEEGRESLGEVGASALGACAKASCKSCRASALVSDVMCKFAVPLTSNFVVLGPSYSPKTPPGSLMLPLESIGPGDVWVYMCSASTSSHCESK